MKPKQTIDNPNPPQVRRNDYGIYVYEPEVKDDTNNMVARERGDMRSRRLQRRKEGK